MRHPVDARRWALRAAPVSNLFALLLSLSRCTTAPSHAQTTTTPRPSPTVNVPVVATADATTDARTLYVRARAARERGDMVAFLAASEAFARVAPNSPNSAFNLACAFARNGRPHNAAVALKRLVVLQTWVDVARETDLDAVRNDAEVRAALVDIDGLKTMRVGDGGQVVARLTDRTLTTEGLARDDRTGAIFVGSAREKKIVRIAADGTTAEWKRSGADGLDGVFGMDIDVQHRILYACSSAHEQMEGYTPADANRAAVFAYDVDSGAFLRRVALAGAGPHACNDLALDLDGSVLVSDATAPAILRISPHDATTTVVASGGILRSPQALVPTASAIFVADYSRGVVRVDRATAAMRALSGPPDVVLGGIDGMRAFGRGFVAIQNGIEPARVVLLESDGERIVAERVIAMNDPRWHEPTLGILVGSDLVYIAASQWSALDDTGKIPKPDLLVDPVVMRMPLGPPNGN